MIKLCKHCSTILVRKTYSNGVFESNEQFDKRVYCNNSCFYAFLRGKKHPDRVAYEAANERFCPQCKITKSLIEFPTKGKRKSGSAVYGFCKVCHTKKQREFKFRSIYNISIEEYDSMFESQNKCCAICKRPPKNMRLAVDHNHKTGQIRGLICWICNRTLGMFHDDLDRFTVLMKYIQEPPAVNVIGLRFGRKGRTTKRKTPNPY